MPPPDLSTLFWTTREEVAARLAAYLRAPSSERDQRVQWRIRTPDRQDVVSLLGLTAGPAQVPVLRSIALNPQERFPVRRKAIWGLARAGAGLPGKSLAQLLADYRLCGDPDGELGAGNLLALARSHSAMGTARRHLLTLTPEERAELLVDAHAARAYAPPELVEWLYNHWLKHDRALLDKGRDRSCLNRQVIRATLPREPSRAVLLSMWREALGSARGELLIDLEDEEVDWTFPGNVSPAELEELAHFLALPPEMLVTRHGRQTLLHTLSGHLHAENRGMPSVQCPKTMPSGRVLRSLHLLRRWKDPELDSWIAEHAIGKRLAPQVRWWLMWVLWDRNRALAAAALESQLAVGDEDLPSAFLTWAAHEPRESDRLLLKQAALPQRRLKHQYLALCGLEHLGEDGEEWRRQLDEWCRHPEPRLRIRALGALAKRGGQSAWELLVAAAESPGDLRVRAEAVATLGKVDAGSHVALLRRTLYAEERHDGPDTAPAAEEAALALGRLGTAEARTVLLRAYLDSGRECVRVGVEQYLTALITLDGERPASLEPPQTQYWRRLVKWPWPESPEPL